MNFRTTDELKARYWLEFLRFVKERRDNYVVAPTETDFWNWYIDHKLEDPE